MERLRYQLTIKLLLQNKSFGSGPMLLLQGIDDTGSLHQSAAVMGMAYSKAWKLLRDLEKEWGFPLIYRCTGGSKGGGSQLTPKGRLLLEQYQRMLQDVEGYAEKSFKAHFDENFLQMLEADNQENPGFDNGRKTIKEI